MNKLLFLVLSVSFTVYADGTVVTNICTNINNRNRVLCLNEKNAILVKPRIYARSLFVNTKLDQTVSHVWTHQEKEIFRKKIKSHGPGSRVVTSVNLANKVGPWQLSVEDDQGNILEKIIFNTGIGRAGMFAKILPKIEQPAQVIPEKLTEKVVAIPPLVIAPEVPKEPDEPIKPGHFIASLGPAFSFTRLDSVQTKNSSSAVFLSEINYGADLGLSYVWPKSDNISSIYLSFITNKYQPVPNKTVINIPASLWRIDFEHKFRNIYKKTHLAISVGARQYFFDRASSTTALNFSTVILPKAGAILYYDLHETGPHTVTVGAGLQELFATSNSDYKVNSATGWRVELGENYQLNMAEESALRANVYFEKINQSTNLLTRKNSNLEFNLLYSWRLGK